MKASQSPTVGKVVMAERDPVIREFLLAFWKIHILHHAEEQGVYGQWMLEWTASRLKVRKS